MHFAFITILIIVMIYIDIDICWWLWELYYGDWSS